VNTPVFGRAFWRAVKDAADGPMLAANLNPLLDANYNALAATGADATSPDETVSGHSYTHRSWFSQRRTFMTNELAKLSVGFAMTNATTSTQPNVTLGGTAPVEIRFIRFDSRTTNELVNWRTLTNWTLLFGLTNGANTITAKG